MFLSPGMIDSRSQLTALRALFARCMQKRGEDIQIHLSQCPLHFNIQENDVVKVRHPEGVTVYNSRHGAFPILLV